MKNALVMGAGGFIGHHMVKRLKKEGYWVRGVDLHYPKFEKTDADHFVIRDLRNPDDVKELLRFAGSCRNPYQTWSLEFDIPFDEIYQFAADMGGAGFVFTGQHDADIMHNSATINLNILDAVAKSKSRYVTKIFYSSSACIYPAYNQVDPDNPECSEGSAYPAQPDSEYGWEKLFSERLYQSYHRNYGIDIAIARYHNIYGPFGEYDGGREKSPAAMCRKVIQYKLDGKPVEIWGDGEQTRSFLYIDDCIDATRLLMKSNHKEPINIGSEEMVTINKLYWTACQCGGVAPSVHYIDGPLGVRGRNSNNKIIREILGWEPKFTLEKGLKITYDWINHEINKIKNS